MHHVNNKEKAKVGIYGMENDKDIATWQDPIEKSAPYHLPDPEFDYSILSLLGRDSIAEADGTESSRESLTLSSPICGSECGSIQDVDETNVLAEADTDIFEEPVPRDPYLKVMPCINIRISAGERCRRGPTSWARRAEAQASRARGVWGGAPWRPPRVPLT